MATTGFKLTDRDDPSLVSLALQGDQMAFLVLYERYRVGVGLHVGHFITIREEVEDVVLESFQKAFQQLSTYRSDYKFSTWLFRIARNTALDHLEKVGRQANNMPTNSIDDALSGLSEIIAPTSDPETDVISSQGYDKLVAAIEGLPELYRQVARMVFLENFGYQEIAEELDIPLGTVKTRVKRSRDIIMKNIDPLDYEDS